MGRTNTYLSPERVRALLLSDPPPPWPEGLRVTDAMVEERPDWSGDDALYIVLLVPDETSQELLVSLAVDAARNVVRDTLRAHNETRFAYVRVLRAGELAEAMEPDEDDE